MTDVELPSADEESTDEADAGVPPDEVDAVEPDAEPPGRSELPLAAQVARATGLLLLILVPIHLGSLLVHDPKTVDAAYLVDRWSNRWWLLADWGLLVVATTHAVLSVWGRLVPPGARGGRLLLGGGLVTLTVTLFFAASWGMLRLQ